MKTITQARLKQLLNYNKDTGIFTWKENKGTRVKSGDIAGKTTKYGYIRIRIDTNEYAAHRLAFLYMNGRFPQEEVDHIDHARNNNSWLNLRPSTHRENQRNRSKDKRNTSGATGVHWCKRTERWHVRISVDDKRASLGYFDLLDDAIEVRKAAEAKHNYHKNHGS